MPQPKICPSKCTMFPVKALRCAENRMSRVSKPTTDMIAPTTSSLRSGERASHQEMETTGSWAGVFFFEAGLFFSFPLEEVRTFPFGFPPDLAGEDGVLRGIGRCVIASLRGRLLTNICMQH